LSRREYALPLHRRSSQEADLLPRSRTQRLLTR